MKLGERLVRDGKLTREQLTKALKMQGLLGGRLGTTLVDESLVDEDAILGALGRQHSTRTVAGAELGDIPPEVVRMIPARLAGRYGIVPFHLKGRTLSVASKDAGDLLKEDEIGFLTSCMVKTCIGLEFRIDEALERYYRVRAPDRNRALVRRLAMRAAAPTASAPQPRSPAPQPRSPQPRPPTPQPRPASHARPPSHPVPPARVSAPAATAAPRAAPPPVVEPQRFIELDEEDAALLGTSSTEIPAWTPPSDEPVMLESAPLPWLSREPAQETPQDQTAAPSAVVAPVAAQPMPAGGAEAPVTEGELDLEERLHRAAAELRDVEIRDDIGDVLLGFCASFFKRRAILVTRKEQIVGWRGEGEDIEEERIRAIDIHTHDPSVFLGLTATGSFWLGALPKLEANQILVDGLGGTFPRDCVVLPVTLRSRVVCYLYGDNLDGGVGGAPIAELRRLAAKAGLAFEVYILKNKLRLL